MAQTPVTVSSLPYTLPTPSSGVYQLTGFTYNNGAANGVVDPTNVTDYNTPVTANAGTDQSHCGVSGTTLVGNNPSPNTGLWNIVSGTGGTIVTPSAFNSVFDGQLGNSYTLQWTISSGGGCQSSDQVAIAFPVAPQEPSSFTAAPTPVCQGSNNVTYTVPVIAAVTYNWSYSGTGVSIVGSSNSVKLNFSSSASSGVLSVTATNSCGTSVARTTSITVNPGVPATPGAITGTGSSCPTTASLIYSISSVSNATTYNWTVPTGWSLTGGSGSVSITATSGTAGQNGNINVTAGNSCGASTASSLPVVVNALTSISSDPSGVSIPAGSNTLFTVVAGGTGPFTYSWAVSTDGGVSWNPVSGGVYSGENTSTLSITAATLSMTGYLYQCMVTGTCSNATSGNGLLTVNPTATAIISGLTSICNGQSATLTVTLTGTPNWSITYTDGVTPVTVNNIAISPFTFNVSPGVTTTYNLSSVIDVNGAGTISGSATITVTPLPATGKMYRLPNQ